MQLTACVGDLNTMLDQKELSPVGAGLRQSDASETIAQYPTSSQQSASWIGGPADLFRDRRVHKVGDILTVEISINDKAALSNNSNLSKKSNSSGDLAAKYATLGVIGPDLKGSTSVNSSLLSAGQGTTSRSEKVELSVAAVVTGILPNGFLVIKGTQEIRVNNETRLLEIAGVVHPTDISENRRVTYDRIAEARISYGGLGAASEVQSPGWGQRLIYKLNPF